MTSDIDHMIVAGFGSRITISDLKFKTPMPAIGLDTVYQYLTEAPKVAACQHVLVLNTEGRVQAWIYRLWPGKDMWLAMSNEAAEDKDRELWEKGISELIVAPNGVV